MNNMDSIVIEPETYFLKPNKHAPNNDLPILIYRDVLPLPLSEKRTKGFLESHAWIRGGTWGHINIRHFHPNTHECYGIFQGESTLLLGCGTNDNDGGQELEVRAGDVIVLPAGTAHCSVQSSKDYEYIGVYPAGSPKWRNELGKKIIDLEKFRKETDSVVFPAQDPVYGPNGPLLRLWAQR